MSRISFFSQFERSERILLDNTRRLDETRREIASGKTLNNPSDNPTDVVSLLRFQNQRDNLEQQKKNITQGQNQLENTEAVLGEVNSIGQRVRELSVRGANDSLDDSARSNIADEMNQRLEELVDTANTKVGDKFIFGGAETEGTAGELFSVRRNGANEIVEVTFNGDANNSQVEVGDGQKVRSNLLGSEVFQATNQEITGGLTLSDKTTNLSDLGAGIPDTEGFFQLDDTKVFYDTGEDSLQNIADRINEKGIDVEASIADTSGGFRLQLKSRTPHQIFLKDIDRSPDRPGRVEGLLSDLEFLGDGSGRPPRARENQDFPNPFHQNARLEGKSIFEAVIDARESLQPTGDADPPGGVTNFRKTLQDGSLAEITNRPQDPVTQDGVQQSLEDLRLGLENINVNRSIGGARVSRMESADSRARDFEVSTTEIISQIQDTDLAQAFTDFSRDQAVQQASLRIASQLSNLSVVNLI